MENVREEPASIFGNDILDEVCASRERGLQLLLMDHCDLDDISVLPSSLRYLFLSNRQDPLLRFVTSLLLPDQQAEKLQ